jgi:transcriptional regulator with XRE-family HTH domain
MSTLAERIIEAMDKSNVSVRQVATACGVTYQAVRKWRTTESKTLEASNLIKLAELTGYEAKWIISGEGPRIRLYARNQAQENTLRVMQDMPQDDQHKVPEIANLLAQHPPKASNGN